MRYTDDLSWFFMLRLCYSMNGFLVGIWLRIAQAASCWLVFLGPCTLPVMLLFLRAEKLSGIEVHWATRIGSGLYIPHADGSVIRGKTRVGDGCYLSRGVMIGKMHAGKNAGVPIIGEGVFIGPGTVVFGGVRIGNRAVIDPNSVVVRDLPAGTAVSCGAAAPMETVRDRPAATDHA